MDATSPSTFPLAPYPGPHLSLKGKSAVAESGWGGRAKAQSPQPSPVFSILKDFLPLPSPWSGLKPTERRRASSGP